MLDDIRRLVECESPSADHAAVARSADVVAALGAELLGVEPERIVVDGVTHLRWRFGGDDAGAAARRTTTRCGRSARSRRIRSPSPTASCAGPDAST